MRYNANMIGHLTGTLLSTDLKSVILDVSGVGYKIHTNTALLPEMPKEEKPKISFWTYLAVRENALDLYGFQNRKELNFFELLLTVSGIGPKSAMGILNVATLGTLRQAIGTGDISHLTKVSGIGKKVAEKIVLELKDKITSLGIGSEEDESSSMSADVDALLALQTLGYSERDAREALKKSEGGNTEEKIRAALKNLNK